MAEANKRGDYRLSDPQGVARIVDAPNRFSEKSKIKPSDLKPPYVDGDHIGPTEWDPSNNSD